MRKMWTIDIVKFAQPLLLALLLLATGSAFAQPEVEATIDPKEVLIGQPATLILQINHQPNVTIFWPNTDVEIPIDSDRVVEILSKTKIDTVLTGGFMQQKLTMQITAWDTGFYIIPPFNFLYQTPTDTAPISLQNYPVLLQVNTIAVDTTQAFRGLKDPIDAPFSIWEYKYHIIGAAVALILLAFMFYIMFRKVEVAGKTAPKPKRPAHEVAMEKLQALEGAKLWQQGDLKTYYSGVSDIMREYLEARFRFLAVESTTDEIFGNLDKLKLPAKHRDQLKEMFTLSDLAKFAKVQPVPDDHLNAMRIAKEFVNQTQKPNSADV